MSVERISLDANILFYTIDLEAGAKRIRAREVLARAANEFDCVLTLQALCEFTAASTRKDKLSLTEAAELTESWQELFPVVRASSACLGQAIKAVDKHNLSFWDAMLWATVQEAKATLLLSEDLQAGRTLGGVRFHNPFAPDSDF